VYFSLRKWSFSYQFLALFNPNDPNKPKPTFPFGQNPAIGSTANPPTQGQSTTTPQQLQQQQQQQPQQQQQQQQQPQQSAFGVSSTPAGFPSTGTGGFGQPQQQTGGFGQQSGFGTQSSGNAFGTQTGGITSAPSTSGGAFGTSGTTNKQSLFGTGLTNPSSAFGSGTATFGGTTLFIKELTLQEQVQGRQVLPHKTHLEPSM
jgi:hypothetical protein